MRLKLKFPYPLFFAAKQMPTNLQKYLIQIKWSLRWSERNSPSRVTLLSQAQLQSKHSFKNIINICEFTHPRKDVKQLRVVDSHQSFEKTYSLHYEDFTLKFKKDFSPERRYVFINPEGCITSINTLQYLVFSCSYMTQERQYSYSNSETVHSVLLLRVFL